MGGARSLPSAGVSFTGFPPAALDFYERLEADNTKSFWQANRSTYDDDVKAPMEAFTEAVHERFRPLRVFRPNRDIRFSKDKTPYKTMCGAVGEREGGATYYLHLGAAGLFAASGYYMMERDQLERFRTGVDGPHGGELEKILAALDRAKGGYELGGDSLTTAPRGWARDHPRIELLRRKGLIVHKQLGTGSWLHTAEARRRVEQVWKAADPLNDWLDAHVGPSDQPPDEMR